MLPSSSGSCAASSQHQAAEGGGGALRGAQRSARRALLCALYAAVLCAALLPPARAAEDAGAHAHREHSRMHHHRRRNGKEVMSGRALTDSGGSTQVWYRKAGEVRPPRLRWLTLSGRKPLVSHTLAVCLTWPANNQATKSACHAVEAKQVVVRLPADGRVPV